MNLRLLICCQCSKPFLSKWWRINTAPANFWGSVPGAGGSDHLFPRSSGQQLSLWGNTPSPTPCGLCGTTNPGVFLSRGWAPDPREASHPFRNKGVRRGKWWEWVILRKVLQREYLLFQLPSSSQDLTIELYGKDTQFLYQKSLFYLESARDGWVACNRTLADTFGEKRC